MGRIDGKVALVAGAGGGIGGGLGARGCCGRVRRHRRRRPRNRRGADPRHRRSTDGYRAAALSAAPAEEHNGRVQGVQGLGRCGESAWRKFNDNLLGRF